MIKCILHNSVGMHVAVPLHLEWVHGDDRVLAAIVHWTLQQWLECICLCPGHDKSRGLLCRKRSLPDRPTVLSPIIIKLGPHIKSREEPEPWYLRLYNFKALQYCSSVIPTRLAIT